MRFTNAKCLPKLEALTESFRYPEPIDRELERALYMAETFFNANVAKGVNGAKHRGTTVEWRDGDDVDGRECHIVAEFVLQAWLPFPGVGRRPVRATYLASLVVKHGMKSVADQTLAENANLRAMASHFASLGA